MHRGFLKDTLSSLLITINFFSVNFRSIEIGGEKVSSSQNERTLGRWGAKKQTRMNKGGGVVKTQESSANVLFECPLATTQPCCKAPGDIWVTIVTM